MRDKDKYHDQFNPGLTEDRIRRAEELLGGLEVPAFVEKRDLAEDYRTGVLDRLDKVADPVDVKISVHPVSGHDYHVLLSRESLPAMRGAEVTVRRAGNLHTWTGRVEPGHPGRRKDDKLDGDTLMVSYFYPVG